MDRKSCTADEQVLAAPLHFLLPSAQWEEFCQALEASPRDRPALKKLLTEASVFDEPNYLSQ